LSRSIYQKPIAMDSNYDLPERTLCLAVTNKNNLFATCLLTAHGQSVEITLDIEDFLKLQGAGVFDNEGKSPLFNSLSVSQ
jgi:hypothetical protein